MNREDVWFSAETLRQILACESARLADDADWCVAQGHREQASRVLLTQNRLQLAGEILDRLLPSRLDNVKLARGAAYALRLLDACVAARPSGNLIGPADRAAIEAAAEVLRTAIGGPDYDMRPLWNGEPAALADSNQEAAP